jgi:hypothetical protein
MNIKHILTPEARDTVNQMVTLMMAMNNHSNQQHAAQSRTYGCLSRAVKQFLAVETGIALPVLQEEDFNWGGNHSYADDAQAMITFLTFLTFN